MAKICRPTPYRFSYGTNSPAVYGTAGLRQARSLRAALAASQLQMRQDRITYAEPPARHAILPPCSAKQIEWPRVDAFDSIQRVRNWSTIIPTAAGRLVRTISSSIGKTG
jgi:hypothetical protein